MSLEEPRNYFGAILFISYIVAALAFTPVILSTLLRSYRLLPQSSRRDASAPQISTLAALAVLSFASLSHHMLSFLITSYRAWAYARSVPLSACFADLVTGEVPLHLSGSGLSRQRCSATSRRSSSRRATRASPGRRARSRRAWGGACSWRSKVRALLFLRLEVKRGWHRARGTGVSVEGWGLSVSAWRHEARAATLGLLCHHADPAVLVRAESLLPGRAA